MSDVTGHYDVLERRAAFAGQRAKFAWRYDQKARAGPTLSPISKLSLTRRLAFITDPQRHLENRGGIPSIDYDDSLPILDLYRVIDYVAGCLGRESL